MLASLCVWSAGCETTLEAELSEAQADEIIVTLHQEGIGARKEASATTGDEARYEITVAPSDLGPALTLIRANNLPRRNAPGLGEAFGEGSLVPTATEERARYVSALGSDLGASLERLEGVLDARVHVALPEPRDFELTESPAQPRASVLLKHRVGATVDQDGVRALVAGAIQGMPIENVAVVLVSAPAVVAGSEASLVQLGPIAVTRGSAPALKGVLVGAVALNVLLALLLIWSMTRRNKPVPVPEEAT